MKYIISFIFLVGFCAKSYAQSESSLPVDERGKLIYYEVVEVKHLSKDSLRIRMLSYLKKNNFSLKFKGMVGDTTLMAAGKLIINKTVLVMSHPSGEVLYNFQVDIKDGKYRFWLTDFNFIPYQRDRYGNFVPSTTTGIPLEHETGKLNAAQQKAYITQTRLLASEFANNFKAYMAVGTAKNQIQSKKIVSKNW